MKDFETIYEGRPDKREIGSSGYSNLKNLYDICMLRQPELIIESGHWKSNSAWLFHHFAPVWSYDIQFHTALYGSPNIDRREMDIETLDPQELGWLSPENVLFYFDDHISHLKRLEWLINMEARYAVFDDNQTEEIAKTLKNPPSPTLDMLLQSAEKWDILHPINRLKHYEVLEFHDRNSRQFDTRLTYIEL